MIEDAYIYIYIYCQDGGTGPRSPTRKNAPKRSSAFSRVAARRMPCDGVKSPTTVKLGKQRRIQKVKSHMLHRLQLQTSHRGKKVKN